MKQTRQIKQTKPTKQTKQTKQMKQTKQKLDAEAEREMGMRFGVCANIEQASLAHAAGYDFIECTVVSLRPEESDSSTRDIIARFHDSPIPTEAFNVLLPGDLKVVGDEVDDERVRRYVAKALERVKDVGGETVVFGSGKARRVPEGFSRERAEEQIVRFLECLADAADPLRLTIAIEPLNTTECNIINSVPEASRFASLVNRPSIGVLADFYHMQQESEPPEHVVLHRQQLRHVHVADDDRFVPGTGRYPYDAFSDCMRRAGYDGRLSIECKWNDIETEAASGLAYLKTIFKDWGSVAK